MKYEATTSQTRKMGILAAMIALMTIVYLFGASPYAGTFGTLQAQGEQRRHNGPDADQRRARNPDGVLGHGQPHTH